MTFSSFKYLIKQGLKNMRSNLLMSISSIGVLTACIFITGAAGILSFNINNATNALVGSTEIVAFLWDSKEQKILYDNPNAIVDGTVTLINPDEVSDKLSGIENILSFEYVSKQEALLEADKMMEEENHLLEDMHNGVRENIFPASFRIKVKDASLINDTAIKISALEEVQEVKAPSELSNVLLTIQNGVTLVSVVLVALLVFVCLIVVFTTIHLTIASREKEINIMKYVGATNLFIRMPFFTEGIVIGLIAALLSFGALSGLYVGLISFLQNMLLKTSPELSKIVSIIFIPYSDIWGLLLTIFITISVVISSLGTGFGIRKYLNV